MAGDVKKRKKEARMIMQLTAATHDDVEAQQRKRRSQRTHLHLDQMAAGLLDVREKKQQREQSVAGWLERSKSPQLMGVSNENTARAQAFTLSREVIFKLFARYVPRSSPTCEKTAQQRDQSVAGWLEKLPGGFINSDAARALTLDPYRECLVLLGVMLCACYKTAAVSAVRNIHDVVLERPPSQTPNSRESRIPGLEFAIREFASSNSRIANSVSGNSRIANSVSGIRDSRI